MASLQEIENELQAINDATFQQLCDEYLFLSEEDYPALNRTGSQKGKRKTKKGTPDAYWMISSGKYVFAEYTTKTKKDSKTAFLKKLIDDLKKCLNERITGISPSLITKIILCFNSEILPNEIEHFKGILKKYNISLNVIGLDALSLNIYSRYQHLAAKYLGVQIDTGQVLPPEEFIFEYSADNSITTPLDNEFLYREPELEQIQSHLDNSEIVVLTGHPGVGKSKLALEALFQWRKNTKYEVYCLSNKYVNIFEDLKSKLKSDKNYVILIDDANRQSQNLLTILPFLKTRRTGKLKLVITARDYALEFIKKHCVSFNTNIERINPLTDEQLESLLKGEDFQITNPSFLKRILQIAKGNPRIAVMAGRLALLRQNINSLHDLYDFYDAYFMTFITDHDSLADPENQKALGIISFFYSIDRSDKTTYQKLIDTFGLEHYKLNEAFTNLERLELVESTADNSILRIGDQVLSTYFFYKCFIKDKVLSFPDLLTAYFDTHRNRFSDTLIPAQSDFGYEKVIDPVENTIIEYFNSISANDKKAYEFLNCLWFCIPDHTLAFLQEKVNKLPMPATSIFKADRKNKNQTSPNDETLNVLIGYYFQHSSMLESGLDIAFQYVEKKPELYDSLYKSLSGSFGFSFEDERHGFYRQDQMISFLIEKTSPSHPIYLRMFFDLFPQLMQTVFNVYGNSWKRKTFSIYRYHLPANKYSKKIRKKIWTHVNKFMGEGLPDSEEVIYEYIYPHSIGEVKEIYEFDLQYLLVIIKKHFKIKNFSHCYCVQILISKFSRLGIIHPHFQPIKEQYYSFKYEIYRLIDMSCLRNREDHEYENLDFDKFERLKEIEVRYKLRFDSLSQFEGFYKAFCEIATEPNISSWSFNTSLDIIIHETYLQNNALAFTLLKSIQKLGNSTGLIPTRIFKSVANSKHEVVEELFAIFVSVQFAGRAQWVLSFLSFLKEEDITERHYSELIAAYQSVHYGIYFDFSVVQKFRKIDKKVHSTVLAIFIARCNEGINHTLDYHFFENYIQCFREDLALLKQAYFICEKSKQGFDHDGKDFLALVKLDDLFLYEYIVHHASSKFSLSPREFDHLSIVWRLDNAEELIEGVFIYVESKKLYYPGEDFLNAFFKKLSAEFTGRAKSFLKKYLIANKRIPQKVNTVLDISRNSFRQYHLASITDFLQVNDNVGDFKKLDLLNSFFMGNGEVIWHDIKASELETILDEVNKLHKSAKYSQHKAYLRNCIATEKKRADSERKRKFMDDNW